MNIVYRHKIKNRKKIVSGWITRSLFLKLSPLSSKTISINCWGIRTCIHPASLSFSVHCFLGKLFSCNYVVPSNPRRVNISSSVVLLVKLPMFKSSISGLCMFFFLFSCCWPQGCILNLLFGLIFDGSWEDNQSMICSSVLLLFCLLFFFWYLFFIWCIFLIFSIIYVFCIFVRLEFNTSAVWYFNWWLLRKYSVNHRQILIES